MGVPGLLVRFFFIYPALLIVYAAIVNYFDIKRVSFFSLTLLFVASMLVLDSFGRKNGRALLRAEKVNAITGMMIISLAFQLIIYKLSPQSDMHTTGAIFWIFGITALLHLLIISASVGLVYRNHIKRGIITVDDKHQQPAKPHAIKNRFLASTLKISLLTLGLIVLLIVLMPIYGYFATH